MTLTTRLGVNLEQILECLIAWQRLHRLARETTTAPQVPWQNTEEMLAQNCQLTIKTK
jgi:hypothetical protein